MSNNKDDWHKPRSNGMGLTTSELAIIRGSFIARKPIMDVARQLQCASRTVAKYYGFFRAEGIEQIAVKPHGRFRAALTPDKRDER